MPEPACVTCGTAEPGIRAYSGLFLGPAHVSCSDSGTTLAWKLGDALGRGRERAVAMVAQHVTLQMQLAQQPTCSKKRLSNDQNFVRNRVHSFYRWIAAIRESKNVKAQSRAPEDPMLVAAERAQEDAKELWLAAGGMIPPP